MPNFIESLTDYDMNNIMIAAGLPSDDRVVHVYDIDVSNIPICAPARYKQGQWIDALTGQILDGLSPNACWGESVFSTEASAGTVSNIITPIINTYTDIGMQEIVDQQQAQSEADYYSN